MRDSYHEQLLAVTDDLVHMTKLVGTSINQATQSLLDADLGMAETVIKNDELIDELSAEVDERYMELAARQHPVATELRTIMSGFRISMSVERMGDMAVHVAKQARLRYPRPSIPQELRGTFAQMGGLAEAIVSQAGTLIASRDLHTVGSVLDYDDEMDRLHRQLFTIVLSPNWHHGVEAAIDVTLLSRYYERFADHAVTISKRIIHIVTGEPYAAVDVEAAVSEVPMLGGTARS